MARYILTYTVSEFPEVHASGNVTAKFGEQIQLSCNVSINKGPSRTTVGKFTWIKDGNVVFTSYCSSLSSTKPLVLNVSSPDVGGIYTCYLEYLLRGVLKRNITNSMIVKGQLNNPYGYELL